MLPALRFVRFTLFFVLLSLCLSAGAQTIEFEPIPAGPYGRGSSISVLFKAKGVFPIGNVFELWLSDVNGNFGASPLRIGNYNSHYTTFINGRLPDTITPSSRYKLRISAKSAGGVSITEAVSSFSITTISPVGIDTASRQIALSTPSFYDRGFKYWLSCAGSVTSSTISLTTTSNKSATGEIKNMFDTNAAFANDPPRLLSFNGGNYIFSSVRQAHYRMFIEVDSNGTKNTQSYFLINNSTFAPFSKTGTTICYDSTKNIATPFSISVSRVIQANADPSAYYNFPGWLLEIDWADATAIERKTIQEIDALNGVLSHVYKSSSCGSNITSNGSTTYNSVGPKLKILNPRPTCNSVDKITLIPVQIYSVPVLKIVGRDTFCFNSPIQFSDSSKLGVQGNTSDPGCVKPDITLKWYLDGQLYNNGVYTQTITPTGLRAGAHYVELKATYDDNVVLCTPTDVRKDFCVDTFATPRFIFNPPGNTDSIIGCKPLQFTPNNQTANPTNCSQTTYRWEVYSETGVVPIVPGAVYSFLNNTNPSNYEPTFRFDSSGRWRLRLNATTFCGTKWIEKWVNVSGAAGISFSGHKDYCMPQTINSANSPHRPTYVLGSGGETYHWVVTPRNATAQQYNFASGTSSTSAYPQINFADTGLYTVSVTFLNVCNQPTTRSQTIRFHDSLGVRITTGLRDTFLCNDVRSFATNASYAGNPLALNYQWSITPSGPLLVAASSANTGINFSAGDTSRTFQLTIGVVAKDITNPCPAKSDQLTIRFRPSNRFHAFPATNTICSNETFQYTAGSSQSGSSYTFTSTATGVTGNTASGNTATIADVLTTTSTTATGTVTYTFTAQKDGCSQTSGPLTVTVNPRPADFTITNSANSICNGAQTNIALSAMASPVSYTWTATGSSASVSGFSSNGNPQTSFTQQTLVNTGTVNETVTYTFTVRFGSGGACAGATKTEIVQVKPGATAASAGSDQGLCNATTATLAGNSPSTGSGQWTIISPATTTATLSNAASNTSTLNNLSPDTEYRLRWSIAGVGGCGSSADTVVITNYAPPAAPSLGPDSNLCNLASTITLPLRGPATPFGGSLQWSLPLKPSASAASIAAPTSAATSFVADKAGSYEVQLQLSNPACPAASASRKYHVFEALNAGTLSAASQTICQGSNASVSVNGSRGIISRWQLRSPGGNWRDTAIATNSITLNNVQQTTELRMVLLSAGFATAQCPDTLASNIAVITVNPPSVAGTASGDVTFCQGSAQNGTVQLTGQQGTIQWQQSSNPPGSNWTNISGANNATFSYTGVNTTTWYRAVVTSGVCPAATSAEAKITFVDGASGANAGPDQRLCAATTAALSAQPAPNGFSGQWSILQANGSAAAIANATVASTSLNGLAVGDSVLLLWQVSGNAACPAARDSLLVRVRATNTPANAGPDNKLCDLTGSSNNLLLAATPKSKPYETSTWTILPGGPAGASLANANVATTSISFANAGNYLLEWRIVNDANCPAALDTVALLVFDKPVAPTLGGNSDLCQGGSTTLSAGGGARGEEAGWQQAIAPNYVWQPVAGSAGATSQTFNNLTDSLRVRIIYRSAGLAAGCTSTDTSTVYSVNVAPPSNGGTLANAATVCKTSNGGTLALTAFTGSILRWESSTNGGSTWQSIANTTATYTYTNLQQTTQYRVVVKSGPCTEALSNTVIITVVDPATPASAGPDQYLCHLTTATLAAGAVSSAASTTWLQVSGAPANLSTPTNFTTQVTGLAVGDYSFSFTVAGLGTCPTTTDTVRVFVRPALTQAAINTDSISICQFALPNQNASAQVVGNSDASRPWETGSWRIIAQPANATGSFANASQSSTIFSFDKAGVYLLEWALSNDANCAATRDTLKITVVAKAAIATAVQPGAGDICAGNPVTFSTNISGITGQVVKWQIKRPYNSPIWKDTAVTVPSLTFLNLQDTLEVRMVVRASDTTLCPADSAMSTARVNVAPPSLPGVASGSDTVCTGTNSGSITLSGHIGQVVNWQSSPDSATWTNIAGSGGTAYAYSNLTQPLWFRAVVRSGVCVDVFSTPAKITVYPVVTTPFAGNDVTLCADTVYQLGGNAPNGVETGAWTIVSPAGSTAQFVNAASPNTLLRGLLPNVTYTLRWTIGNGICDDKTDDVVITNTNPLLNLIDTATVTICSGQNVPVNAQLPSGGQQPYLYQWQVLQNGSWTNIPGANQQSYVYTGDTVASIRRQVIANPCENYSLAKTIYVQPPIGNNTVGGNAEVCVNVQPSILTGSQPTGADGNFLYQWQSSPDSATWTDIAGATLINYQPPILTTTTFYRRVVTTTLCAGAQASTSAGFRLNVRPDALAQWNVLEDTACAPFLINDNVVRPQIFRYENSFYRWFANGNFYGADTAINPGHTLVNAGDSVLIKMVAVSRFGCRNDSIQQWFFTFPKPVTSFEPGDTVKCGPTAISFTNTTPLINRFRYEWNFGNGIQSTAVQPLPVTYATNPNYGDTVYVVSLKAITECDTVETLRRIRIKSRPKALFAPDKTNGCSPMNVAFSNISKGLNVSFRWDFGDGSAPVFTNRPDTVRHSYSTGLVDTFYARLIASNECGDDTSSYAIVVAPRTVFLDVAINGNEATGCSPHAVRFINRSQGAAAFRWDFGDGNILNTTANVDTVTHVYQQAGTFRATVQATNNCSDTADVEIVRVFASPIAAFTALPATLCIGDTVRFNNQTDTATGYLWQFADGNTGTATNPVHSYNAAGTYQVKLISTRQYGTGNACRDTATQPVLVVPSLPGNFSSGGLISSCVPFTTTFSNQSLPAQTVRWTFGDGSTGTGNTVSHTYTRTGLFVVRMEALDPGGCTYVKEDTVRVNGPSGSWQYDAGFVCNAAPVRFQFNVQSTDSVRIDFGDGSPLLTTTQAIVYHSYPVSGNYIPKATLLFGPGGLCRVTLPQADTIKSDVVKAGFMLSQNSQCGSNSLQFTDTSRSGYGLQQWQWQFGDGQSSTQQNPLHVYVASNNYPVRFIATSTRSGCADTAFNTIPVKVKAIPVATILAPATGCAYQPISFAAQVQSADTVTFHRWNFSNGLQLLTSSTIQSFAAGNYNTQLIVGTNQGCYDTVQTSFVVNPSPVTQASADQRMCRGQATNLSASGAPSLEWFPQDGSLSCISCANPIAKPTTTTQYIVTGTNNFGCQTRDTVLITVVQPLNVTVAGNDSICIGSSTQLVANGANTYQWSPGSGLSSTTGQTVVANPAVTTRYQVIGFDAYNCFQDTAFVTVAVGLYPTVRFNADTLRLNTGAGLRLNPAVTNGPIRSWVWTPSADLSCADCPSPLYTPRRNTCLTATATTAYGCSGADTLCITTFCQSAQVFIPNAFTPDGDGRNDLLIVRGTGINQVRSFRIFNRWGQVVFERSRFNVNDASNAWDGRVNGKPASPDVYVYTCEVVCENETTYTYKGNVTILQ